MGNSCSWGMDTLKCDRNPALSCDLLMLVGGSGSIAPQLHRRTETGGKAAALAVDATPDTRSLLRSLGDINYAKLTW